MSSPIQQHGPWQIIESREVYRDPWTRLRRDEVIRPDGNPGTYSVVDLKPGVSVLAIDDDDNAYLTEEFHYGVGRVTIETVSGGIEEGEDACTTAERELQEELGISATRWTDLGSVDPFTANVVSPTRLFLAESLTTGKPQLEGTELIRCVKLPFQRVVAMTMAGEITHAPSAVLILKVALTGKRGNCG
ncbi:MAG: NUDIX hydrolase [Planctomycetaceae bacterium]|nr:NUDIX hydrolase [Planctomycetales bacterium]MCB9873359.1 NUDIX hydrolase [Planctomycetaceae bacterium]MCB9941173.1 NUDIX hydrolase [Planctomycetaceae bacterium]